jgi:hypothetical protein
MFHITKIGHVLAFMGVNNTLNLSPNFNGTLANQSNRPITIKLSGTENHQTESLP